MKAWALQDVPKDKKWVLSARISLVAENTYWLSYETIYSHQSAGPFSALKHAKAGFARLCYPGSKWTEIEVQL